MAASGATEIVLYNSGSTGATPLAGDLVHGELALNYADGKLFYKDATNTVQEISGGGGGSGTVTTVSVVSANGLAGTVANATTTPAITLSTSVTGILQGNGTAISAASTTGSGNVVLATSPTLVTPVLGTPASGNFSTGTFTWPTFNQNTTGSAGSVANALTIGTGLSGTSFDGSAAVTIANTGVLTFSGGTTGLTPSSATNGAITLGGTLVVANGGTGATTLTGYVKGSGTSALTASATIPNTDITGLGTMSTQNANSVAITGGTVDGTTIGGTSAAAITGTTIIANTAFEATNFDAATSGGGALRNASGTACFQWGGGGGVNCTVDGPINMNGANAAISIAPTGTGTATINPATAGTINNMSIGGSTAAAGTFTDFNVTGKFELDGAEGTAGQVLTAAGAGNTPTWTTPTNGTVTTVSVATANGFAGTVANPTTTPAITLTTSVTGILQGNGTAISAASTTGSGNVVLATSPTLVTPALGTPTSGNLSNCTNYPASGLTGLGANVATFLATPSSANLAAAVTDETGTGALVFANTPTLVTPDIGAATGTSLTVTGAIQGLTVTSTSDERLKYGWKKTGKSMLNALANVKSGTFKRKGVKQKQIGVSAQSLQEVMPEAVVEGDDGYLSVAYGNAALVAAIELAKEVKQLKLEIAELKAQLK